MKKSGIPQACGTFFEANGINNEKKIPVFLTVIGNTTYALLSNLVSPAKPKDKSFTKLAKVLQCHFDPKPLVIAERFHFRRPNQAPGESVNDYMAELRQLAAHCNFGQYLTQALKRLLSLWDPALGQSNRICSQH